ncbi:metallopeptidase family protein [Nigerium massiliense]|uniref:metallopeptidase family protein n=1 Tax=Nigerium massiliense TaxID=1522317 RepID=UPI00058F145D|nr:metallopeptidase family protein [Nigerium massiliense]
MAIHVGADDFDALVEQAIDQVPDALFNLLENCVILVEDDAPADMPRLLGLYEGIPLTSRDSNYAGVLPDRIRIFRRPILSICHTTEQVVEQVYITVVHEIAHFFGIGDERLHELGYA